MIDLEPKMAALAATAPFGVSIAVCHIERATWACHEADQLLPLASTYKVAMAVTALQMVARGELALDQQIEILPIDYVSPGVISDWLTTPRTQLPLQTVMQLMLAHSDNSATDILFRVIGGAPMVAETLAALSVSPFDVSRSTYALIQDYFDSEDLNGLLAAGKTMAQALDLVEHDPVYRPAWQSLLEAHLLDAAWQQRFAADHRDKGTARAMTDLLVKVARGQALPPDMTKLLWAMMARCQTGDHRLRAGLPPNIWIANKTGTLNPHCGAINDAGLIRLPDGRGHIAISVFCAINDHDLSAQEQMIAAVARLTFNHFCDAE